ncbi:hypothetical protein FHS79_001031 [Polymorphobacter multimanifer]|uniref:Ice-binding protein C-terminal domain-containing protein n=1 Tax=Polymorphobacter multimanifer TaxID=1070431 RepID=A0A841L235_9SPHN|nr:PEPxxWA-CTERM sorting domain-containing protein [Polymorphobacter multimanifer]MBB6226869.1 hypothetical protein [Polymorphobacter multimanifer]
MAGNFKACVLGAAMALVTPVSAMAVEPIFYNTDEGGGEGDGSLEFLNASTFRIIGSDNGAASYATYEFVALTDFSISTVFRYGSVDSGGPAFDPAGYFINDQRTQLSDNDGPRGVFQVGTVDFSVLAGDGYGFYVYSSDGLLGRGKLTVGALPEPGSWALMIAGFGLVGASMRRRRAVTAA